MSSSLTPCFHFKDSQSCPQWTIIIKDFRSRCVLIKQPTVKKFGECVFQGSLPSSDPYVQKKKRREWLADDSRQTNDNRLTPGTGLSLFFFLKYFSCLSPVIPFSEAGGVSDHDNHLTINRLHQRGHTDFFEKGLCKGWLKTRPGISIRV